MLLFLLSPAAAAAICIEGFLNVFMCLFASLWRLFCASLRANAFFSMLFLSKEAELLLLLLPTPAAAVYLHQLLLLTLLCVLRPARGTSSSSRR